MTDKFREAENELVRKICVSKNLPWFDKCLIVSALTLSLLRHFDQEKVFLLLNFYETQENQVWHRALVGVILGLYYYDKRIEYLPEIIQRLKILQGNKNLEKDIESIVIQFIREKETEKISKKIREEFLPDMMKMKSTLEEKLDLDNILSSKTFEDKNPDWETFFKDSPDLYKKIEDLSMMQIEGADIFLGAFAMLKRFPFFNEISNWLIPFFKENKMLEEICNGTPKEFNSKALVEGLEQSHFLCNSDKYSFCLNIKHIPDLQKTNMMDMFNMELKAMKDLEKEEEILDTISKNKKFFTQYLQDLYRFFKLHPFKNEFDDIFDLNYEVFNTSFFDIIIEDTKVLRNIGEYYFQNNQFTEAQNIFIKLPELNKSQELLEKIAFCHQQTGNFEKALEHYHKAELLDSKKKWISEKIAYCYRRLKNYKKSLEYYLLLEKSDPDNLHIQADLGHIYMCLEDYETALKYYYKIEYLAPDNHKIQRPIAWCSFILGKFDSAKKYFEKVIKKEANKNDYINLRHVNGCFSNKKEALEKYKLSIKKANFDFNWFSKVIEEDSKYLSKYGMKKFDIPLMIDYLKIICDK